MYERSGSVRLRQALAGVAVTSITPFDAYGRLDRVIAERHARWMVDHGIRLIIPGGNTGEFHSLTRSAWRENLDATLAGADHRALVAPAVGGAVDDALEMARAAQMAGADGILVLPLHHTFTSDAGIERYVRKLLDGVDIGVITYVRSREQLGPALMAADHANFIGMKFAIPDVALFANTVSEQHWDDVVWSCGIAEQWAPFFVMAGASGFTSGIANFCPELPLALHRALVEREWAEAMRLRGAAVPFELLRSRHSNANNVPAVKAAMKAVGLDGGLVCPPLTELPSEDEADLRSAVELVRNATRTALAGVTQD